MLETLDLYQINWNLVLLIPVMGQVEVVHVKYHLGISVNSITINGWLRNLLWSEASQVIQSYALSSICPYGFIFLIAHFIWAFSLMFLFSGRAYWQELIESILWSHHKLKIIPHIQPGHLLFQDC